MTKVKSISIEGLNQTPIADKALDEAQTQSSVAATDCIPLKGADGNIHKIRFDSFLEAVSSGIAALMNNTNKGQTLTKLLGLDANGAAGASSLQDAAAMLGEVLDTNHDNGFYSSIFYDKVFSSPHSCASCQSSNSISVTIPNSFFGGGTGGRCSIFIVTQNTETPSIFVLGRKTVVATIYDGSAIHEANLAFNSDGSLTVTKKSGLSLYFRVLIMEW